MVRLLYVGPVPVVQSPVITLTDIAIPDDVRMDRQFGRRVVHVHLNRYVDWRRTARGIDTWRFESRENADAANAIVSIVIDEWFAGPSAPVFEEIARALGFGLLCDNDDPDFDPQAELLRLFRECREPGLSDVHNSTFKGRGWRVVRRDCDSALQRAWLDLCDDFGPNFGSSRRVSETDWTALLGATGVVECDIKPHGASIGLRFRQGPARSSDTCVNAQIEISPAVAERLRTLDRPSEDVSVGPPNTNEFVSTPTFIEEIF